MSLDKLHCFGSQWFCLQMQEAFTAQRNYIENLIQSKDPKVERFLPLLVGIESTSHAVCHLRRNGLLNESHVLMRLLIERAINTFYLSIAPEVSESSCEADINAAKPERPKFLNAEELIKASIQMRFTETYDSEGLERKIQEIGEKTIVPTDFLRLCISTHYPMASMALSGSKEGAICHLGTLKPDSEGFFHENFTTIFFLGALLLNYIIAVVAKDTKCASIIPESQIAAKAATDLMNECHRPIDPHLKSFYGHWQALCEGEFFAKERLEKELAVFSSAFSACMDAGIDVVFLGRTSQGTKRLAISAVFLKRILNDLRCVWLMLCQGYTSQGASITASLFEYALAIRFICEDEQRATKLQMEKSGELPWSVSDMCKDAVRSEDGKTNPDEEAWKFLYVQYVWLCQIKHPTLGQASHDAGATSTPSGQFAVIPLPDVREEDLDVKKLICIKALHSALGAINSFARASGVKSETVGEKAFEDKIKIAEDVLVAHLKSPTLLKIPFTVANSKWAQKQYAQKRKKSKI